MDPLNLVASMVLENGQRWGEAATPHQWADMKALLSPDRPRRHFWLRPRGGSKTFDTAAATIAVMLTRAGPGDEMYAAAAGKDQAGLLANKIASILRNTPELAGAVDVQQNKVLTPSTGAVLEVLSSELAGSWGKTPLWIFIDEMCNHDNTPPKDQFVTSLTTSLPKRADSVCLICSTPSSHGHWSYRRWERALESRLWRTSVMPGPSPWQDPEELEDERTDLEDWEWQRLFLCQWASADDVVADDEAVTACTRTDPLVLEPLAATQYMIGFDIGWKRDHSAVVVAHIGERAGRRAVIVDRLDSWTPSKLGPVRIGEVLDHAAQMSRDYNGAPVRGDPTEAEARIQDLREDGYDIRGADTGANANSVRAKHLLRMLRDRALEFPADPVLRKEILSLRLAEGATPGIVRLASDGSAKGHFDRVMALSYALGELINRPGWSWRQSAADTRECESCHTWYVARAAACYRCHTPNPAAPPPGTASRQAAAEDYVPPPGGYAAAYLGAGARKCPDGHIYSDGGRGAPCTQCARAAGAAAGVPAAFARALTLGRR